MKCCVCGNNLCSDKKEGYFGIEIMCKKCYNDICKNNMIKIEDLYNIGYSKKKIKELKEYTINEYFIRLKNKCSKIYYISEDNNYIEPYLSIEILQDIVRKEYDELIIEEARNKINKLINKIDSYTLES